MAFNPAQNPLLNDFQGGQMTDLPAYPGALDLTALMEIVSPGNAALGVNYGITFAQIIALITAQVVGVPTFVISGATYNSVGSDTRILVNKTIGSATSVVLALSTAYAQPVLVKDLKGDADTNPITVTFSGGQTLDGLAPAQVVISNPYGYFWFNPLAAGGWYDAAY